MAPGRNAAQTMPLWQLPKAWLLNFYGKASSGPEGLATAAALEQTCKAMSTDVIYRNLHIDQLIDSTDHSVWDWLAKREGKISGLKLTVAPYFVPVDEDQEDMGVEELKRQAWERPLQILSAIPGLQLTVQIDQLIESTDHPVWDWLAQREGKISGLTLTVAPYTVPDDLYEEVVYVDELRHQAWERPLQILSAIPGLQLTVQTPTPLDREHPFVTLWLMEHSHLIGVLTGFLFWAPSRPDLLSLEDFCSVAGQCSLIKLRLRHGDRILPLNLSSLTSLSNSLVELTVNAEVFSRQPPCRLEAVSALRSLSRLTGLGLISYDLRDEGQWMEDVAALSNLRALSLLVAAADDAPPVTETFTALTKLELGNYGDCHYGVSSLQPLSALQQLEVLGVRYDACGSRVGLRSLEGLTALRALRELNLRRADFCVSLEGVAAPAAVPMDDGAVTAVSSSGSSGTGLTAGAVVPLEKLCVVGCPLTSLRPLTSLSSTLKNLSVTHCSRLSSLAGLEHLTALEDLEVESCHELTSLRPLENLRGCVRKLTVKDCDRVRGGRLVLPYVKRTAKVSIDAGGVASVALADGQLFWVVPRAITLGGCVVLGELFLRSGAALLGVLATLGLNGLRSFLHKLGLI